MAVEASGLSMLLDNVSDRLDAAAANRAQLRGLAPALQATGIPVQAPDPTLLGRLFGVDSSGTPSQAPGLLSGLLGLATGGQAPQRPAPDAPAQPLARMSPAAGVLAPTPMATDTTGLPVGGDGTGSSLPSPNEIAAYVGQGAQARGIAPMLALRTVQAEGGFAPATAGDGNSSYGPFQLHYGNVAGAGQGNQVAGLGDDFTRQTGLDARDPANWRQAADFALDHIAQNGWGAFHGAAKAGITGMMGISGQPQGQDGGGVQLASYTPGAGRSPAGASAFAPPVAGNGGPGVGSANLPKGLTLQAIAAMVQEPTTRAQGLELWKNYLQPPTTVVDAGKYLMQGGRIVGQTPAAPIAVPDTSRLYDPASRSVIVGAQPNLQATKIGTDDYGQPAYGAFDPKTGAVSPFPGAPGVIPQTTAGAAQPAGADFLKTLPPPIANQVQAVAEGRLAMPSGQGANSAGAARMRAMVLQYDPSFDATDTAARAKTRADFASGPTASTITAGNTAIAHLGELSDAAEALGNGRIPALNAVGQAIGTATGGNLPGVAYNNTLGKYAEEVTKFYRGTGGTEADLARDMAGLSPSMSPAQLRAALQAQKVLLQGKVNALQDRWRQGMGPLTAPYPVLTPNSLATLARIGVAPSSGAGPSTSAPAGAPPAAAASPIDQARAAIARGAPRDAVIGRLQKMGVDTSGL